MLGLTPSTFASENFFLQLTYQDDIAIQQCVNEVNQLPADGIDTSSRLYRSGMCYFCKDCGFLQDNGQLFQTRSLYDNNGQGLELNENYQTAHKLVSQAAGLENGKAYYGLAVLKYFADLTEKKKTKLEQSTHQVAALESEVNQDDQPSVAELTKRIYEKMNKEDYSSEIHRYLLMAAKQGYLPAQFGLSEIYFEGIGVAPDHIQAYAWAATAVAQNPPFGSLRRDEKAVNLNDIELNKAEAIAEQYMKNYTNIFDRSSVTVMR